MIEALSDIEALVVRCRSDQSREYVSEAIRCYQAGAYRAAIVSTWVAVVFDLIDKVRELSLSGDAAAKNLEKEHEKYMLQIEQGNSAGIKGALEFERALIESCRDKLNFFDPQQFLDLDRLRQDRHRCAHPSFQRIGIPYKPPAEQARLHIRNAIVHVLTQPPVQGKAALAEIKTLVSSMYFPTTTQGAVTQLKSSSASSGSETLIKGIVDLLVFGFFENGGALFYKGQVYSALNALFEMYPSVVEAQLSKQLSKVARDVPDNQVIGACALFSHVTPAWRLIDSASKDKISSFVNSGPVDQLLPVLEYLFSNKELAPYAVVRVSRFSDNEFFLGIEKHGLRQTAKEHALQLLSRSHSWDRTNELFAKCLEPLLDILSAEDVERIISMPKETQADLRGAHGFREFLASIKSSSIITTDRLNKTLEENDLSHFITRAPLPIPIPAAIPPN